MYTHRDEKLDRLIGKVVEVTFISGRKVIGILGFTENFSATYNYRKPSYYTCEDWDFRKSHIKNIREI